MSDNRSSDLLSDFKPAPLSLNYSPVEKVLPMALGDHDEACSLTLLVYARTHTLYVVLGARFSSI